MVSISSTFILLISFIFELVAIFVLIELIVVLIITPPTKYHKNQAA